MDDNKLFLINERLALINARLTVLTELIMNFIEQEKPAELKEYMGAMKNLQKKDEGEKH